MRGWGMGYGENNDLYELVPEKSIGDYLYIDDKDIPNPGKGSAKIIKPDRTETSGKYVHQLVVFTYGDCNGRPYTSKGLRCVIDHIDMDHAHNEPSNLQLVSDGINLWRAYSKTKSRFNQEGKVDSCESRFKEYYNSLDDVDKMILRMEIELDMQGKY